MTNFNEFFAAYKQQHEESEKIERSARAEFMGNFAIFKRSKVASTLRTETGDFTTMWKLENIIDLDDIKSREDYIKHDVLGNAERATKCWVCYRFDYENMNDGSNNSPMSIERALRGTSRYFEERIGNKKEKDASAKSERKYKMAILLERLDDETLSDEERAAIIAEYTELLKIR